MKKPIKPLRLQIFPNGARQNNDSPNTPNLLTFRNTKGSDNQAYTGPTTQTKAADKPKKVNETEQAISQFQLFRYATRFEIFLICCGGICALGSGCLVPSTIGIFSIMVKAIVEEEYNAAIAANKNETIPTNDVIINAVKNFAIGNSLIGLVMVIFVYTSVMLLNYTCQRQAFRIRQLYLKSVLHQDISWYDRRSKTGNVATELTEDVIKFEEGIGEKFAIFMDHLSISLFSIVFAFYMGWKLTFVCLLSIPFTSIILTIVARVCALLSRKELDAFGAASSVAQEALSGIKTVVAFGGQVCELERYKNHLSASFSINKKIAIASGFGFGFMWIGVYASYALSQWFGIRLILEQRHLPSDEREYDASVMISVFFCTMIAAMNIGALSPYIEVFAMARAAASKIFAVIERQTEINSLDPGGHKPAQFRSTIEFKNVKFQYPSRPEIAILSKLNLTIKKGETVALVGSSGCGKSTCIQLLQRFYDPIEGQVLIDGYDIRDLNLAWLRSNIGIVGQEPVLFDTTIAENIRYGNLDATMEMVTIAAKKSNAHDFIMKLPSKYDTLVGEKGVQMSGGQKQRIAIARALIRDPVILLLDEATSALDTRSESKVQAALDKAHRGRTTIIVAHRLTTIRNADKIIVLSGGEVVESGRHDELMELKGHYHGLVTAQISEFAESQEPRSTIANVIAQIDEDLEPITMNHESNNEEDPLVMENEIGTWKVLKLNKPEWKLILIAGTLSILVGSATPLFAILFGGVIEMFSNPDDDWVREQSPMYAVYFVCAGLVIGISTFLQISLLTIASESLTTRLRGLAFETMLKQEMAWFDERDNSTGALCAKLSTEAASVKGATGQRIGTIIQSISTILIAIGLAVYYDWRLGLVGMVFIPVILCITYLYGRIYKKETLNYQKGLEKSTKVAVEAVSNIRTVVGLGREETFFQDYVTAITPSFEQAKINTHYRGIIFALFKSMTAFAYAAVLYYGGILMQNGDIEFAGVFKVAQAFITGTAVIGQASAFSPNLQKGVIAAAKMIRLIERQPKIQDPKDPQQNNPNEPVDVTLDNVSFEYATRPGTTILDSLNLEVEVGKTVALIGSSGCGKSTVIKLLERFYDATSGTVNMNGTDITTMTQASLRMTMGLVEQEPTVFARTIWENIAYGDNTRNVPLAEIIAAAKKANIHNFVGGLPLGYETNLGDKGTMLSGGQKQRIAIARALLRNPQVLLLDEATSALDTESEKIVQAALDEAKAGRTCIVIAHRLSTIEDADKICVFQKGTIVESGTHKELIEAEGHYYAMLCLQNRRK